MKILRLTGLLAICLLGVWARLSAQIYYQQDFNTSNGGWTSAPLAPASSTLNSWVWSTPAGGTITFPYSGTTTAPSMWRTGGTSGAYTKGERSFVQSPSISLAGAVNPMIKMWVWWDAISPGDSINVQYSTDGGTTWKRLGRRGKGFNWYNTSNPANNPTAAGSKHGWSGKGTSGSNNWVKACYRLEDALGNSLAGQTNFRVRVNFYSSAASSGTAGTGFAFDDVVIAEGPNVDLGGNITLCYGDTLNKCAVAIPDPDYVYLWKTPTLSSNNSPNNCVPLFDPGTYKVTVRDTVSDIELIDSIQVGVSTLSVYLGSDKIICPGTSATFTSGNQPAGTAVNWGLVGSSTVLSTAATYTVNVNSTVWVKVSGQGCTKYDTAQVYIEQVPTIDLGPDVNICAGQSKFLDALAPNKVAPLGTQFKWTSIPAGSYTANTQAVFLSSPGTYQCELTTPAGCVANDIIMVTVKIPPVLNLGPDKIACFPFTLDANNPGNQYLWSTGETTQTIAVTPVPGTPPVIYSVIVTGPTGCVSKDTIVVTPDVQPTVTISPKPTILCSNVPLVLNAGTGAAAFLWNTGAKTQTITVTAPGKYSVIGTNPGGCFATDETDVIIAPVALDLGKDTVLCTGSILTLNATTSGTGVTYKWTPGNATTPTLTIAQAGTYSVTVTNSQGCSATDQIIIAGLPTLNVDFTPPSQVFLNTPAAFTDNSAPSINKWEWDFGNGQTANVKNPTNIFVATGNYDVKLTASDGKCSNTKIRRVVVALVSIDENELGLHADIYPNPAHDQFTIDIALNEPQLLNISLVDLTGKTVYNESIQAGMVAQHQVAVNMLPAGVYILKLATERGAVHQRVVVE